MRIFNVSAELAPYSSDKGLGAEVAKLLAALAKRGHEVRAIAPLPADTDPSAHSLARRLKPIAVNVDGREVPFTRFEGRTASGIDVDLLQPAEALAPRERFDAAFNRAALELVRAADGAEAACISWDRACAPVAALDAAASEPTGASHYVAIRTDARGFDDWAGPPAARRVILMRPAGSGPGQEIGASSLAAMLEDGRAFSLSPAVDDHPPLGATDRASAKAAMQAGCGLPVRADVPLIAFAALSDGAFIDALGAYLRGDTQAIAIGAGAGGDAALDALADRYPDRLTVLPDGVSADSLLAGADFCAALTDPSLAARARSFGAVPITTGAHDGGAVDLEPSLESGTSIIADGASAAATVEALGRAVSAFRLGKPFAALATRIQGAATTWPVCAERFEQILLLP